MVWKRPSRVPDTTKTLCQGYVVRKFYQLRDYFPVYAGALAFVGVLVVAAHVTIDRIAGEQQVTARMIEMSGRQRMLSQRTVRLALEYVDTNEVDDRESIRALIDKAHSEMRSTHMALTQGDASQGIPAAASGAIDEIFFDEPHLLDQRVRLFMYDIREILAKPWDTDLQNSVYVKSVTRVSRQALLASLQDATEQFMTDSLTRVEALRTTLKIMHGAILIALIGIGVFVFTPLFRRVAKQSKTLADAAHTDPLSGGLNRRGFMLSGAGEFSRASRYGTTMSVIALDVDRFKGINDTYGHAAGDDVIRHLAETCTHTLRSSDTFGRLGGEEFGILLPETDILEATKVAEKLRELLASEPAYTDHTEIRFTVSMGVAEKATGDSSLETLLNRADIRMFAAKNAGRNRVVACEDEVTAHAPASMADQSKLKN